MNNIYEQNTICTFFFFFLQILKIIKVCTTLLSSSFSFNEPRKINYEIHKTSYENKNN